MVDLTTFEGIRSGDFIGFQSVATLREERLRQVPELPGVYMVLRDEDDKEPPSFLEESVGGHFKGKDPTVPVSKLEACWVPGAIVLNIGKAGGAGLSATLRSRIKQYVDFGARKRVGHRGGRYIWQLAGSERLILCWKPTPGEEPLDVEQNLISQFRQRYGKRPFANLRD